MAFSTPAGIAPKSPPPKVSSNLFPTRDWPQSLSFCCWRSRSAPLSSIVIQKSFVATRPAPLRWPGNCACRSRNSLRLPALPTLPQHPIASDRQRLPHPIPNRDNLLLLPASIPLSPPRFCPLLNLHLPPKTQHANLPTPLSSSLTYFLSGWTG